MKEPVIFTLEDSTSLEESVFRTLGYASMCWETIPTGVFHSTAAKQAGEELLKWIRVKYNILENWNPNEETNKGGLHT